MYIKRLLDIKNLLANKSFFLFGPRASGKSSLIKAELGDSALIIDLLRSDLFMTLNSKPWELENIINARTAQQKIIVIDEIQKIPELLNEVHRLIEQQKLTFLLTGSSARKLKKSNTNLLAGRAWEAHLFPFIYKEIPNFELNKFLKFGGLPVVYLSNDPTEELIAYVNTYLKEEIQAEALVRKMQSFTRFLEFSALTSGKMLNFSSISNDIGIPASTIREYYSILEDTLIGFMLPAWVKTKKRKAISTAKFYYFDIGVRNQLAGIKHIDEKTDLYGQAFEHFIAIELKAYLQYKRKHLLLSYWQSTHGNEVDFIVGDSIAIEVKTTSNVTSKHCQGLRVLQEENICEQFFLISFCKINKVSNNIHILYWEDFINKLWQGELF